jgi:hypothetical protein
MTDFYIGKTFPIDEYELAYNWLQKQNNPYYCIEEIEPIGEVRQFKLVDKTPSAEEQEREEKERVAMLSLTRGDVFRGLLQAKGVTRSQLRAMIETNPQLTEVQKEMALIDFDEALNFYRGNALIDTVGLALGITPYQLDKFFEYNDYTYLQ